MKHDVEELKLNNGARLINVIVKNLPITLISVWFRAGSRFDPIGKEGLAHFLEHLYMKRVKKYSNEIERLKALESRGIKFNAYTSYETTHFYHIQEKDETNASLEFLVDGLDNYVLDDDDIEKEKGIVINELLENKSNPFEYIWNLSNQAIWQNSTMGKSFFGSKKSIKSIEKSDLEKFIKQYYTPQNCTFVIVGNENTEKLGELLNKRNFKGGDVIRREKEIFKQSKKISISENDKTQATVAVAFRTFSINNLSDLACMDFIRDYLGNKWISKLVEELRLKRDFTYWVDGVSVNFSDTGFLRFVFSCNKKHISQAVGVILNEIEKIKNDSFYGVDLSYFKKSFSSSLAIRFTDPYEYLWWYGWQAAVSEKNKLFSIEEYVKLIQEIKPRDMQVIAKKYLNKENISISVIGNIKKSDMGSI